MEAHTDKCCFRQLLENEINLMLNISIQQTYISIWKIYTCFLTISIK